MKKLFIYVFVLFLNSLAAQNLVPNPSFEDIIDCPYGITNGDVTYAIPWISAREPYSSSDLLYNCSESNAIIFENQNIQFRTGIGVASFSHWHASYFQEYATEEYETPREYIQVLLDDTLIQGEEYVLSFYCYFIWQSTPCDAIGGYFSEDTVYIPTFYDSSLSTALTNLYPQVENPIGSILPIEEWNHVTGSFVAQGGEKFLTLGNFRADSLINYSIDSTVIWWESSDFVAIDDVSVYLSGTKQEIAQTGNDTTLCIGESMVLESHDLENYLYHWTDSQGNEWDVANPTVSPDTTTTYYLSVKDFAFYETFDSITVTVDACNENIADIYASKIKVYPNPANSFVEIESGYEINSWMLLDAIGREVASSKYLVSSRNLVLDISSLDVGLYFLEMELDGVQVIKQLMIE